VADLQPGLHPGLPAQPAGRRGGHPGLDWDVDANRQRALETARLETQADAERRLSPGSTWDRTRFISVAMKKPPRLTTRRVLWGYRSGCCATSSVLSSPISTQTHRRLAGPDRICLAAHPQRRRSPAVARLGALSTRATATRRSSSSARRWKPTPTTRMRAMLWISLALRPDLFTACLIFFR
jgi:hypothetical protein